MQVTHSSQGLHPSRKHFSLLEGMNACKTSRLLTGRFTRSRTCSAMSKHFWFKLSQPTGKPWRNQGCRITCAMLSLCCGSLIMRRTNRSLHGREMMGLSGMVYCPAAMRFSTWKSSQLGERHSKPGQTPLAFQLPKHACCVDCRLLFLRGYAQHLQASAWLPCALLSASSTEQARNDA